LLDDDEPLDRRAGTRYAEAGAEAGTAAEGGRHAEEDLANACEDERRSSGRRDAGSSAPGGTAEAAERAEGRPPEEAEARPAVTDGLTVEATGETVGEAKWAALRELERLNPEVDKASVRFEVVTEGERGLLGVGYAPARVIATAELASAGL